MLNTRSYDRCWSALVMQWLIFKYWLGNNFQRKCEHLPESELILTDATLWQSKGSFHAAAAREIKAQ